MVKKATSRTEEAEQARVVKWSHKTTARTLMPALRWLHHSPNGGKRDAFTGAQMKALGVKPGFPDLILPARSGQHPGLVIEMKSDIGRVSTEQAEWLDHLTEQGWSTAVARSAEAARIILCDYLGVDPVTAPPLD
jgi:hypothetical protein